MSDYFYSLHIMLSKHYDFSDDIAIDRYLDLVVSIAEEENA